LLNYQPEPDPLRGLDAGNLLLIAQIGQTAGKADLAKRALALAEDKDKPRHHWRWRELATPEPKGGK
jgi:hypothetical protein